MVEYLTTSPLLTGFETAPITIAFPLGVTYPTTYPLQAPVASASLPTTCLLASIVIEHFPTLSAFTELIGKRIFPINPNDNALAINFLNILYSPLIKACRKHSFFNLRK